MDEVRRRPPQPPQALSKETVGVWAGWGLMGDKEVAREAAAKGLHIDLAITFLATRKRVNTIDAESWLKSEVVNWVGELLERRQIFKASHVLKNIGLDPIGELARIFYNTSDGALRQYIGDHLTKSGSLDESYCHLWDFLESIIENRAHVFAHTSGLEEDSIKYLEAQGGDWKSEVATTIFLKVNDSKLFPFVTPECLWKHLLSNSDLVKVHQWINLKFNQNVSEPESESIIDLFKEFPITPEMINSVDPKLDLVLNELSQFGIFRDSEINDLVTILKRVKSHNLGDLYKILSCDKSVVSLDHFMTLLVNYCLERRLFSILSACLQRFPGCVNCDSIHLKMIQEFNHFVEKFTEESLSHNVFEVSKFLSADGDLESYFSDNPVILLGVLLFVPQFKIVDVIMDKRDFKINDLVIDEHFFRHLPLLIQNVKAITSPVTNELTVYDLLDRHLKVNCDTTFFKFRSCNFQSPALVANYAYSKRINYKFYLRHSRPSAAAKLFIFQQLKAHDNINEDDLKIVNKKVYKLALNNFECNEITSSCVAFMEIIGLNSHKLKVMLQIGAILSNSDYSAEATVNILFSSEEEPYTLQHLLENILMETIEARALNSGSDFFEAFETYKIVIQYSKLNMIKLPELLLKHFAAHNLWLPFLIFVQLNNYPLDHIKLLIQFFKNPNLSEHLTHAVINDFQIEAGGSVKERDHRKFYLSRLGLGKDLLSSLNSPSSSLKSYSSIESENSSGSDFFEIDISNIKATLLQTLIRCHNSTDPPRALLQACQLYRNPLLAIFATTYEPDSVDTNWLTWLAVSCDLCHTFTNYETVAISALSVSHLLEKCMKHRHPRTLLESFQIFKPDHPLKLLLEFLNSCLRFNFSPTKLDSFRTALRFCRQNSVFNFNNTEPDHELTYLTNRVWIERTALRLLALALNHNCNSHHEQILVVEYLCQVEIWDYFTLEAANNFKDLLKILKSLEWSSIKLDVGLIFDDKRQAIVSCINSLLEKHDYKTALEVATIESLPPDLILIKEWQNKMGQKSAIPNFWTTCDETLRSYKVTADCVVDFYSECADSLSDPLEKFTVWRLSCQWAEEFELSSQFDLERKMWVAFMDIDEKHRNMDCFDLKPSGIFLYSDLVRMLDKIAPCEDFGRPMEKVISFALNKGDFWLALRLQKMFAARHPDLEILKFAFSLAEGIISPQGLSAEQRILLSNTQGLRNYRRTLLSARLSSFSSVASHSPANSLAVPQHDLVECAKNDVLAMLKILSEKLQNGVDIGQRLFMTYRISANIEIPYHVVIVATDLKILKDALEDDCLNKLDVVHDFMIVHRWSKREIADFMAEQVISSVFFHVKAHSDHVLMWDVDLDNDFQSVLQLLPSENCSVLGHSIYKYAVVLHKSQVESKCDPNISEMSVVVELLVRAHDCFTVDCNMEGISLTLKKSKEVVANLLILQEWKLIVRLLTGIARYTEMSYVFQILMENDQFEFLLHRTVRKDNGLKVALFDFLNKYCPDNRDLYKIVVLHFTLFSEVALLWEKEARILIQNLVSIAKLEMQNNKINPEDEPFVILQNTDSTKNGLKKAMENYCHATDFHIQGDKLSKALYSTKQAELIALQLGLLTDKAHANCLFHLSGPQINHLILNQLSFEQSLILVQAYNFNTEWASVLYEQYVVRNNTKFFDSFLRHFPLSDGLVYDISRKFISSDIKSVDENRCMKNVLQSLPSLQMKYRIASELGFVDLVEDLIAGGQLVYLKDTVWKKGYKS